jgi:hypothetical protein
MFLGALGEHRGRLGGGACCESLWWRWCTFAQRANTEGLGEKLLDRIGIKYPRAFLIATTTAGSQHSPSSWFHEVRRCAFPNGVSVASQPVQPQVPAADDLPQASCNWCSQGLLHGKHLSQQLPEDWIPTFSAEAKAASAHRKSQYEPYHPKKQSSPPIAMRLQLRGSLPIEGLVSVYSTGKRSL